MFDIYIIVSRFNECIPTTVNLCVRRRVSYVSRAQVRQPFQETVWLVLINGVLSRKIVIEF